MRLIHGLVALCTALVSSSSFAGVVLKNAQWQVTVEPDTFAIRATPAHQAPVTVSTGVDGHRVASLIATDAHATWSWDDEAYRVDAVLEGQDLALTIHAKNPGELRFLRQPGAAMGQGLILPLAEGHYVPRGNAVWRQFMVENMGETNTAEDLSLPLWGNNHGAFSLSWLLTSPFDNRLRFSADDDALAVTASHQFTALNVDTPLTLILHLGEGDTDLLDAAKRYRRWLIATHRFETLEAKRHTAPDVDKLIGATHVYLWGGGLLAPPDVRDWTVLVASLRGADPLAGRLRDRFDAESRKLLATAEGTPNDYEKRSLLDALNSALNAEARNRWLSDEPDMTVLVDSYGIVREQVKKVFGAALTNDPSRWGGGVSLSTMHRLRASGLSHLWIGLGEGWEGGLWHPEAIASAVEAGYLIGPYDSYETALPRDVNPDWITAHLDERAYSTCAIVRENGTPRPGFQGNGHYTDPRCVRPLLEARISALHAKVPFNSWFLDAYATGMSFESTRPSATMTRQQNADGNIASMSWVSASLRLPTGSEGGNAATAQGLVFAHGMQTPVIGWGDRDLGVGVKPNRGSRYYVGNWYPAYEPAVFFKPVPMKEPYRTVHFDPAFRLPLYQAVFHDSIVTTHHWHFDNLKLTNVHADSELTQMLYNVPALYHLSAGSLATRLPAIKRQDAFFSALHRKLGTQALTGFSWLSADRRLQQTTFADGTRLVANFSDENRETGGQRFDARSATAIHPDGTRTCYKVDK